MYCRGNDRDQSPERIASRTWVESKQYLSSGSLSNYYTKTQIDGKGYLTSDNLSIYATQNWVTSQNYVGSSALNNYVHKTNNETISGIKTFNSEVHLGSIVSTNSYTSNYYGHKEYAKMSFKNNGIELSIISDDGRTETEMSPILYPEINGQGSIGRHEKRFGGGYINYITTRRINPADGCGFYTDSNSASNVTNSGYEDLIELPYHFTGTLYVTASGNGAIFQIYQSGGTFMIDVAQNGVFRINVRDNKWIQIGYIYPVTQPKVYGTLVGIKG